MKYSVSTIIEVKKNHIYKISEYEYQKYTKIFKSLLSGTLIVMRNSIYDGNTEPTLSPTIPTFPFLD